MLRFSCFLFTLVSFFFLPAQGQAKFEKTKTSKQEDNLNKTDKYNRKQGLWYLKKEAVRGEPAYSTFGTYVDDKKNGLWYTLNLDGELVSLENFKNGNLNGTSQYFTHGNLSVVGNYRNLDQGKQMDSIWVTDPITLYDTLVVVPSSLGSVRHGIWRYYNPDNGQLIAEEVYQIDQLLNRKEFQHVSKTDSMLLKKRIQSLPHNKHPVQKQSVENKSPLYPNMNGRR